MTTEYFEDCRIGNRIVTPGRTITEADIVMFAAFTGDWNAVHTDAEFAGSGAFGERIAHGMLTLVVGTGLLFRLSENPLIPKSLIAVAGVEKVRFILPVKIGDTIHLEGEIAEMTKMPGERGILVIKYRIKNQHLETVVAGRLKLIAGCRPSGEKISQKTSFNG